MAMEMTASPRTIGAYELLAKIAEGGMGEVFKARSQVSGEIVAIKIIPAETAKNPVLLKRFEQEFRAASLLDHPNVVKAIEYCGTGSRPFLVMEYVDGLSLGRKVELEGALSQELALHIIAQVCDGLHRAHKQGLIHRDVKPDNILVTADGVAKLTDLGLVKEVDAELNLTKTGRGLGTPHYMAPEQFRNAKNVDVRCDIYSLGATLYMMLTGVVPFSKTSPLDCWMKKIKNDFPEPKSLMPEVTDRVNWAVTRAMSADPANRPASCREFLEDLNGQKWQGWSSTPKIDKTPDSDILNPGSRPALAGTGDLWYLVYKNPAGEQQKVKGTTESIRQNVKAMTLGDTASIMICRTKTGPFVPLRIVPEFRDLVIAPGAMDAGKASGKITPTAANDTARARATASQAKLKKRSADPAMAVPTEKFDVKPLKPMDTPRIPVRAAKKQQPPDYMPWLILALAVTAMVVGLVVFAR